MTAMGGIGGATEESNVGVGDEVNERTNVCQSQIRRGRSEGMF